MSEIEPVALLEGLLACYSPTGQEGQAVAYLVDWLRARGFDAAIDEIGNAVGSKGSGPNEIVLLGHIDTVPGAIAVRREGDTLWGRGSVDAKGPLACFAAAAALVEPPAGWKVSVIGSLAEEGDSKGALFIRPKHAPRFCVIGEPSNWDRVTLAYKGTAWIEYSLRLPIAHTAAGYESACEGAVRFWNALSAKREVFNRGKEKQFDQLSASLRSMESGDDGFYETAKLKINVRLPPDLTPEQAAKLAQSCRGAGEVKLMDGVQTYRADKNTALVRAFLAAIRAQGGKPGFLVKTGTSDMNLVGPAWGCPILAYGPGDSSLDHTPEERIQIPEYLKSIQVLKSVLERLMES